jgi:hypothetical protein
MQFARSFTFIFAILASSQAAFAVEDRAAYF